jgi:hypothetical protein
MKIFEHIIKSGDLVFDIGSNLGDKSDVFLSLGSMVIAFEPQIECYEYTLNRFRDNKNFIAENLALDEKIGVSQIFIASYHTISSMSEKFIEESKKNRFIGYSWDQVKEVSTNTLDNMIIKYGKPNFIKIDVEGYELNVLKGLKTPIDTISIEYNPELCSIAIDSIEYIDSLNNNKTLFNYGYRNDEYFKYDEWITKDSIIEYLKSVNDFKFEFGDVYCKRIEI